MLSEALLPELDHEMAMTRRVLERVPDEALAWKPHDKSFSLGDLVTHLVNIPSWIREAVDRDVLDIGEAFEPPATGNRDRLLEIFDENVRIGREKLAGASDEAKPGFRRCPGVPLYPLHHGGRRRTPRVSLSRPGRARRGSGAPGR